MQIEVVSYVAWYEFHTTMVAFLGDTLSNILCSFVAETKKLEYAYQST